MQQAVIVVRPSDIDGGTQFVRRGLVFLLLLTVSPSLCFTSSRRSGGVVLVGPEGHQHQPHHVAARVKALRMVRNIDFVEALLFYGHASFCDCDGPDDDITKLLPGVENLIEECQRDETAVLAIVDPSKADQSKRLFDSSSGIRNKGKDGAVTVCPETSKPPNPRDLWEAIHSIHIQPKGFGGSSGFGRKAADPIRCPLPKHCVVLCHDEDQCRAARYAGMRVLCLTDNDLADAVVDDDWGSVVMDDIATPGSFWLNPPHPRDDEGNKVDPTVVMEAYEKPTPPGLEQNNDVVKQQNQDDEGDDERIHDEYLASILNDMDPL